ncbi:MULTISPECIES: hypothetical protein [unclassified Streptomyces]|uniref:hypothetical protein n=1 Tax=unclassified Streptomyces TaxID=2593676 RepID=UPI00036D1D3E|nr:MULTISPECIES: hypothetical protein [unclassified Streptomyces]MYT28510.1 hypothetical protein [Streptomyces sp. SID8354]
MPKNDYAKSAEEAEAELKTYCEAISFDHEWISAPQWDATIRIAQDKKTGYTEAFKSIDADKDELFRAGARDARQAQLDGDAAQLLATAAKHYSLKTTVAGILQQLAGAYVDGHRVYLTLGGQPMDATRYADLRDEWDEAAQLAAGGVFTGFVSHPPQNKLAVNKGNVGDTKETRKVQGDLLVKIGGVRFNMHVNIAD